MIPSFKLGVCGQKKILVKYKEMKEKRVLTRNPFSIEDGVKHVIETIGEKGLKEATGKGKDTFLKMSNPTHPGRDISVNDAVKIDIHCRKKGLGSPLMDCYRTMMEKAEGSSVDKSPERIQRGLLQVGEELGDVFTETRKALEDGEIDDKEREKIAKEIKEVEVKLSKLKQKLDLGKQHDYSKFQKRDSE